MKMVGDCDAFEDEFVYIYSNLLMIEVESHGPCEDSCQLYWLYQI